MLKSNRASTFLVVSGAILLFVGTAIHTLAAYPRVSAAITAAALRDPLPAALRAVFLLAGWDWFAIGVLALMALRATHWRRILLLFCAGTICGETLITLALIGPFAGNEIIGSAAFLILMCAILSRAGAVETGQSLL
jgi:hypothetical protein